MAEAQRLRAEDRRTALIDAAAGLVASGGVEAVSMDAVAARANVSRPLVYKHFANRHELLAAVYRRQATELDAAIAVAVGKAEGFEDKIRALVRSTLEAVATHGPIFTPLARAGVRDAAFRKEQRARDRRTVRFFEPGGRCGSSPGWPWPSTTWARPRRRRPRPCC
jgi:AcrR family transcriptional regulator